MARLICIYRALPVNGTRISQGSCRLANIVILLLSSEANPLDFIFRVQC